MCMLNELRIDDVHFLRFARTVVMTESGWMFLIYRRRINSLARHCFIVDRTILVFDVRRMLEQEQGVGHVLLWLRSRFDRFSHWTLKVFFTIVVPSSTNLRAYQHARKHL